MASGKLRTCLTCGKQYKYCGNCNSSEGTEPWRNIYCSSNCHDIWYTLSDFEEGFITIDDAKKKIESYDLSRKNEWSECVKDSYGKLYDLKKDNEEGDKVEKAVADTGTDTDENRIEHSVQKTTVKTENVKMDNVKTGNGNNSTSKDVEKFKKIDAYARQSFNTKKK